MLFLRYFCLEICFCSVLSSKISNRKINIELTKQLSRRGNNGELLINYRDAKALILKNIEDGVIPDHKSFTAAIQVCYVQEQSKESLNLYELMKSCGCIPDRLCFGLLMMSCLQDDRFETAKCIYSECDRAFKLGSSPRHVQEDAVIVSTAAACSEKLGNWTEVLQYYNFMVKERKMKPNLSIVNSALRACKRLGNWKEFYSILSNVDVLNQTRVDTISENDTALIVGCVDKLIASQNPLDVEIALNSLPLHYNCEINKIENLEYELRRVLSNYTLVDNSKLRRRILRLVSKLECHQNHMRAPQKLSPSKSIYITLLRSAGYLKDAELAFRYFQDLLLHGIRPDRSLFRELIESCSLSGHQQLTSKAKELFSNAQRYSVFDDGVPPEASVYIGDEKVTIRNGPGLYSRAMKRFVAEVKSKSSFLFDVASLPERGSGFKTTVDKAKEILMLHCEKQAAALLLQSNSKYAIICMLKIKKLIS